MTTNETGSLPLLERFKYVVLVLVGGAVLTGVAVLLLRRPEPTTITVIPPGPTAIPSMTPLPSSTPTPGPYTVYITGAVHEPETVTTLVYGSRVMHALDAAGGPAEDADLERVNLAQVLLDGDQVHVPTRGASDAESGDAAAVAVRVVTATPGAITVYVTGAVAEPQSMVSLEPGSRVRDALAAAGGATDDADLDAVNLSAVLNDGDYVYVPPLDEPSIQTPTPNRPPLVHINIATAAELETLPGIGPALAQAIIDYREENGPFTSIEQLDEVPGIGPAKLDGIRDQIVID